MSVQARPAAARAVEEEALRLRDLALTANMPARSASSRSWPSRAGPRTPRYRPAQAPAPPDARRARGRGARLAARHKVDARAAARAGAQLGEGAVLRLCDGSPSRSTTCARAATPDCRSSAVFVKVTRPSADLEAGIARLQDRAAQSRGHAPSPAAAPASAPRTEEAPTAAVVPEPPAEAPPLDLSSSRTPGSAPFCRPWSRRAAFLSASLLREAQPTGIAGEHAHGRVPSGRIFTASSPRSPRTRHCSPTRSARSPAAASRSPSRWVRTAASWRTIQARREKIGSWN